MTPTDEQLEEALMEFAAAAHRLGQVGGLDHLIDEVQSLFSMLVELQQQRQGSPLN